MTKPSDEQAIRAVVADYLDGMICGDDERLPAKSKLSPARRTALPRQEEVIHL
jgi:hypothetical protein